MSQLNDDIIQCSKDQRARAQNYSMTLKTKLSTGSGFD